MFPLKTKETFPTGRAEADTVKECNVRDPEAASFLFVGHRQAFSFAQHYNSTTQTHH